MHWFISANMSRKKVEKDQNSVTHRREEGNLNRRKKTCAILMIRDKELQRWCKQKIGFWKTDLSSHCKNRKLVGRFKRITAITTLDWRRETVKHRSICIEQTTKALKPVHLMPISIPTQNLDRLCFNVMLCPKYESFLPEKVSLHYLTHL